MSVELRGGLRDMLSGKDKWWGDGCGPCDGRDGSQALNARHSHLASGPPFGEGKGHSTLNPLAEVWGQELTLASFTCVLFLSLLLLPANPSSALPGLFWDHSGFFLGTLFTAPPIFSPFLHALNQPSLRLVLGMPGQDAQPQPLKNSRPAGRPLAEVSKQQWKYQSSAPWSIRFGGALWREDSGRAS